MNQASTRSHCIFTIHLMSKEVGSATVRRSKLHLVDLAGLVNHASAHSVKIWSKMIFKQLTNIQQGSCYKLVYSICLVLVELTPHDEWVWQVACWGLKRFVVHNLHNKMSWARVDKFSKNWLSSQTFAHSAQWGGQSLNAQKNYALN